MTTMRKKFELLTLSLVFVAAFGTTALAQTPIDDVQVYTDAGLPASPFDGQSVTIRGVITVNRGTYNSGTHYVQDATGGMTIFDSSSPALAVGDEVEVTGTVTSFPVGAGEIQLGTSTWTFINSPGPVTPAALTVAQVHDNDNSGTLNAADFEIIGDLVTVTGTIAYLPGAEPPPFPIGTGQGSIGLTDGTDTLLVFIDRTTGIDPSGLDNGDAYAITSPVVLFNNFFELKPRFQTDLVENPGNPAPVIQAVVPTPWTPIASQSVVIEADITDNGSVASATLFYADAGTGSFSSTSMTNTGGDTYEGTIPGTTAAGIDYYIMAADNTAQTATVPASAPASVLQLAVGTTSIIEIQQTMIAGSDSSAFHGDLVNVEGVITVAPGELQAGGTSNYIVADPAGGDWSGLFVFEGSGANVFFRGDQVRISGFIGEFAGSTEILPQAGSAVELVNINQPLPPIEPYSTDVLDLTEALESVVVQTFVAAVTDTVFAGLDWLMTDAASDSAVYVDSAPSVTYVATIGDAVKVTGVMDTRFGRNELVPRNDLDISIFTAADDDAAIIPERGFASLKSINPNPFNPSTTIKFSVPETGLTDLSVYNSRGERVRNLVSGSLEAGDHELIWDGRDQAGASVSSGVYYAWLRFDTQRPTVQKMTLVK